MSLLYKNKFKPSYIIGDEEFCYKELGFNIDKFLSFTGEYSNIEQHKDSKGRVHNFGEYLLSFGDMYGINPFVILALIKSNISDFGRKNLTYNDVMLFFKDLLSNERININASVYDIFYTKLFIISQKLKRYNEASTDWEKVNCLDSIELVAKNKATSTLYKLIPWVGVNNYKKTTTNFVEVKDEFDVMRKKPDGKVTKIVYKTPFGMYRFWLEFNHINKMKDKFITK